MASNQILQVDPLGPVYLRRRFHRYYVWVGKDLLDSTICLRLASSRLMDEVLGFLGECWKEPGRPIKK